MSVNSSHSTARKRTPEALAFAAQLRAERARVRMSMDELARQTGISKATIVRLEAGTRVMDTSQLGSICRALGISIGTFVARVEESLREDERHAERLADRG